jgi:CRP/FNR family cyclic AMP-dependent transcriptional regulator
MCKIEQTSPFDLCDDGQRLIVATINPGQIPKAGATSPKLIGTRWRRRIGGEVCALTANAAQSSLIDPLNLQSPSTLRLDPQHSQLRQTTGLQRGSILNQSAAFDSAVFLANSGLGRTIIELKPKETFFCQGDAADSVFYLQKGRARVTVVSQNGKEATITLLSEGEFVGEESLATIIGVHMATATAVNTCTALKIGRSEMIRVMHEEPVFADVFLKFLLARSMRTQADLVDQLFNSSEKRLARILLLMAEFGRPGEPETFIPPVTQETLADMIGTTRSRVSFFMNRFRKLGFISYNGRIQVHKSLLNVVLLDQLPERNAQKPAMLRKA